MTKSLNTQDVKKAQPFIKWVGGKRGLLSQIIPLLPKNFNNYFEPFVGGGALFFELYAQGKLEGKKVYLFDINTELINTYEVVRDNPAELIKKLNTFKQEHSKEYYYDVRAWDRKDNFLELDALTRATRFIYLNKTCFNGLYRVNKSNQNNVPMGSYKNPNIADEMAIYNASEALKNATILNASYKDVLQYASKDDLVYFDPPYYPLTPTASFTSYSEFEFLDKQQEELYETFCALDKKGCSVMHSNSDTSFIKELYRKFDIQYIQANRFINSKSNERGKISEVFIRNENMKKDYDLLSTDEKKTIFTENLVSTNRGFNFYVDWRNAEAYEEFDIELNALNVLIRIGDNDLFEGKFILLLKKLPTVIKTFPLLFSLARKEREDIWKGKTILNILEDVDLDKDALDYDFIIPNELSSDFIEKYYDFFKRIGLKNLFQNLLEKNVLDYVTGVLVGLDSHGRKNRGGKAFELASEPIIRNICQKYGIELLIQKQFKYLQSEYKMNIDGNIANRKADFILIKNEKVINIEANFYFASGSKPEEIIDSYANRQYELKQNNIEFIYLTDGVGCWGNIDKNQLIKGFNSITYILNFYMLKKEYFESIIKKIFKL
ncbi:MAG: DpnII family type II restriction endonuclease [Campylobacterota bacterium]|nr:DpnII family type II restriction endonuclease [Campylobacterota bacterium]